MTITTNSLSGRIIIAIVSAVILGLGGAVIADQTSVSVLKVQMRNMDKAIEENKAQVETNRKENNEAHDKMQTMLQELLRRK